MCVQNQWAFIKVEILNGFKWSISRRVKEKRFIKGNIYNTYGFSNHVDKFLEITCILNSYAYNFQYVIGALVTKGNCLGKQNV